MRRKWMVWLLVGIAVLSATVLATPARSVANTGGGSVIFNWNIRFFVLFQVVLQYIYFLAPQFADPFTYTQSATTGGGVTATPVPSNFDAPPGFSERARPGTYAALAGVVIQNSAQCPGDYLVVFVSNPAFGPVQMLSGA